MKSKSPSSHLSEELTEKKLQTKYIVQNLEATYGTPRNTNSYDPIDELILTILSQSTSDINSHRAFDSLKKRFVDWESVRRARPDSIAAVIKSGGLANTKSVVIKNVLTQIKALRGKLDLSFLRTAPIVEAREFLTSLKGIGPKTAACVLLFSCKRPVFPMDTHIFRITRRLGLVPEKCGDIQAHEIMERLVPPKKHYSFHINLIRHGRSICRPRNPQCQKCPLIEHCEFGQSLL
ncbi:MAG: endonuclease III [Acidobacteria bacterium]|nr:endonuclease III [Acidobacteriota bacterium]